MGSAFAVLAALVVTGLLLALDPGGAIEQSGFPATWDIDWKQLAAWGFRLVGAGAGLVIMIGLWLKYRPPPSIGYQAPLEPVTQQPSQLPAAAVSVLEERDVTDRTLLAAIVEMCQRGTLQIEPVATGSGYAYRISQPDSVQYDWERFICEEARSRISTVQDLRDRLHTQAGVIGDRLGEYLHARGYFDGNPVREWREHSGDGASAAIFAGVLIGVAGGLWLALWIPQWWACSLVGAALGLTYWLIAAPKDTGMLPPTESGSSELPRWLSWKESLSQLEPTALRDEPESALPYAVALNAAQPWLTRTLPAPAWFGSADTTSMPGSERNAAYHAFMSAPAWGLAGRSDTAAAAAAGPGAVDELGLFPTETQPRDLPERTAEQEMVPRYRPPPTHREPERVFYQDGEILVSQRRLALPDKTIDLNTISSAWVTQQPVATGESVWFLKISGAMLRWGGALPCLGAGILTLWSLAWFVLNALGLEITFCDIHGGNCQPYAAPSPFEWALYVAIIITTCVVFLLGGWLESKAPRTRTMYCAAVSQGDRGSSTYFAHSTEPATPERIVAEIRRAQPSAGTPGSTLNSGGDQPRSRG